MYKCNVATDSCIFGSFYIANGAVNALRKKKISMKLYAKITIAKKENNDVPDEFKISISPSIDSCHCLYKQFIVFEISHKRPIYEYRIDDSSIHLICILHFLYKLLCASFSFSLFSVCFQNLWRLCN